MSSFPHLFSLSKDTVRLRGVPPLAAVSLVSSKSLWWLGEERERSVRGSRPVTRPIPPSEIQEKRSMRDMVAKYHSFYFYLFSMEFL